MRVLLPWSSLSLRVLAAKRYVGGVPRSLHDAVLLLIALEHSINLVDEVRHDVGLVLEGGIAPSRHLRIKPEGLPSERNCTVSKDAVGPRRDIGDPVVRYRPEAVIGVEDQLAPDDHRVVIVRNIWPASMWRKGRSQVRPSRLIHHSVSSPGPVPVGSDWWNSWWDCTRGIV